MDPKIEPIEPARPTKNTYTVEVLANRFGVAFGNAARKLLLDYKVEPRQQAYPTQDNYSLPAPYIEEEEMDKSKIGTPFFDRFIFRDTDEYKFEIPPMVDLSKDKKISVTEINNAIVDGKEIGGGEVIESMGSKAWDITFRGLLIDMDNHKRPLDQMRDLHNIFKVNAVLDCKDSKLFNALGIDKLYVKRLSFPPLEGFQDTQPFIIESRQYVPATLEILV